MEHIIWYGAGKNLSENARVFLQESGIPSYICDADTGKQGHHFTIREGLSIQITSLQEAVKKIPDYEIWITLADHNLLSCIDYLTKLGVETGKIRLFGNREYRLGCNDLEHSCFVSARGVRACCVDTYMKVFEFDKDNLDERDFRKKLDEIEAWRCKSIETIRNGGKVWCSRCPFLKYAIRDREISVKYIAVMVGEKKCNCRCFYCNQYNTIGISRGDNLSFYDYHRIIQDYYDSIESIFVAAGEPTLIKDIDRVLELSKENSWSVTFLTNGLIYSDKVAQTITANCKSSINLSLDSGTQNTYKKIKRVDKFDTVVSNLCKYSAAGCMIYLKYIILPGYNDNLEDINGFIAIAKEIGAKSIIISQNKLNIRDGNSEAKDGNPEMSEETFMYIAYMITRIKEEGLRWEFDSVFFSKKDLDRIDRLR